MNLFRRVTVLIVALAWCVAASAAPAQKEKEKEHEAVDSGSFGIFQNGHRVGTETFSIYQSNTGSVIKSEFKTVNAPTEAVQQSEMDLTNNGEIRRYEWHELSPGKAESVLLPNEEFLNQKFRSSPQEKETEQAYLLPHSTSILDDYFFIHREVAVWKFLASACHQEKGLVQCPLKQRVPFGTVDPRQRSSAPMTAEFMGREKINFKGAMQEFNKVEFRSEAGNWSIWLDDQYKVMRMYIDTDNTEVIRD